MPEEEIVKSGVIDFETSDEPKVYVGSLKLKARKRYLIYRLSFSRAGRIH